MVAYGVEYVVHRERFVVYLDRAFDDPFCQAHVYLAVVDYRECQQRVDYTLKVAHASVGCLCYEPNNFFRYLQSVALYFAVQYVDAELYVGFLQLGYKSAAETCQQSVAHALKVDGRTVACQNYPFAVAEKVVEYVEERLLGFRCRHPFLYVIHNQHVDGLVEVDEVICTVLQHGVGVLHLEQSCADVKHTLLRIKLLCPHADGIDKVCLSAARRAINEHRVELCRVGVFGNRQSDRTRKLVAVAFNIVGKRMPEVEL